MHSLSGTELTEVFFVSQRTIVEQPSFAESSDVILSNVESLWQQFFQWLPLVAIGLVVFILLFLISNLLSKQLMKPLGYISSSTLIQLVMRRIIRILIILLGLYIFLRLAGLSDFAVAVLSGTGVIGLIIGFAFKDIAENFISSLLLSIQKPFKINDIIEVEGHIGVVKQVTARATTLVDFDGDHIQIPNSTVYKNIIRNITANPNSRGKFVIGIGYDSSVVEAQKLALETLKNTESVLDEPEPQVLVDELASSTVNLKIYFWINSHNHSLLKVSSYLMRTIMRKFENAGISMPDDAREVIFPEGLAIQGGKPTKIEVNESDTPTSSLTDQIEKSKQRNQNDIDEGIELEDLSSDAEDIRQQAKQARDPENGENIL